ncbi:type IV pilus assembly protein PilM [Cryobacterium sp. W22_MBD10_FK3]|uniref:type IV pilus assembly protein PilM n=1 Tax=Cryobacterium sp. W22_MBD10_FK3 TaxID=3240273 RepID=UPI003F8F48EF
MKSNVVGIDIGSTGVRAVELSDSGKARPTVVKYHAIPLPEGSVVRGEVQEINTVAEVLKRLWSAGGFGSKNVVMGMGNHRVLVRDLTVPSGSMVRIRESLPFHVQDMLPVPVADALLDFYPISEEDDAVAGPQVHGLLVAAVKQSVQANVKAVQLAGLIPVEVDLIPFALSRVVYRGQPDPGVVVQIDVGARTTSVVVTSLGSPLFVRIIPTGGDDLTQALVDRLPAEADVADAVKRSRGLAPGGVAAGDERAVGIIREVTTELLSSLRNTITYFASTRPSLSIDRIVLAGGGSSLIGFGQALSELTRLNVVFPEPLGAVTFASGVSVDDFQRAGGEFYVALGLAIGSAA